MARMQGRAEIQVGMWLRTTPYRVEPQYRFHPERKWLFDWALPELLFAVEVDGVLPGAGGGHQRRQAYIADRQRDLEAMLLGWQVIRVATDQVSDGTAFFYIERLLVLREQTLDTARFYQIYQENRPLRMERAEKKAPTGATRDHQLSAAVRAQEAC